MDSLSLKDLNKVVAEMKTIRKCTNLAIHILEHHIQIVPSCSTHFFAKYAEQNHFIKLLIISDKMFCLWITLNLFDLWSFWILVLAGVRLEDNSSNSANKFRWTLVVMNPVAMVQFFEAIYTGIFKYLLAASSIKERLFGPVSTYCGIIKNKECYIYIILYSYAKSFIWLNCTISYNLILNMLWI